MEAANQSILFFVSYIFSRCWTETPHKSDKKSETYLDYRCLLEKFLQGVLKLESHVEWPGCWTIIETLCRVFIKQIENKQSDIQCKMMCIDFLLNCLPILNSCKQKEIMDAFQEFNLADLTFVNTDAFQSAFAQIVSRLRSSLMSHYQMAWGYLNVTWILDLNALEHGSDLIQKHLVIASESDSALNDRDLKKCFKMLRVNQQTEALLQRIEKILVALLDSDTVSIRLKALKAADQMYSLSCKSSLTDALVGRLLDTSASIRDIALDSLGRMIKGSPLLIADMLPKVFDRLLVN